MILGVTTGQTILIHGAGSTFGYSAVQIALLRGARVLATAGSTYAGDLAVMGATVTSYGKGMAERVLEFAGGPVDLVLDTSPVGGALPDLVTIAGGDPRRVMTVSDFAAAAELGMRSNLDEDATPRYDVLAAYAAYAASGKFTIPVAKTFPLTDWRTALEISETGQPAANSSCFPTPVQHQPTSAHGHSRNEPAPPTH
jgi:D-arabinose 1-dehydrogenase-like Zn-dependent alcohol dehydrogenase